VAEACVPGTSILRTSVIGTWADVIAGIIAGYAINPRIPLTLDLEVHILKPARVGTRIRSEATPVKVGRTVTVVRNSVTIIDRQEIEGITGGALDANEGEPGPFYIQGDHTGGLKFRNITVSVPKR